MPWGRLDDGLYDHPKLDDLGRDRLAGVGLWTLAISWSNRRLTDGLVPLDRIRLLGGTPALADRLVAAGLFDRHPDGYVVHDFLAFNESREQIEARRESDRKRKRKPNGVHPDSGDIPAGSQPETDGTPIHATRGRAGRVAPAGGRPDPTDSESTPQPPASGGRRTRARDLGPMRSPTRYDDLLERDDPVPDVDLGELEVAG